MKRIRRGGFVALLAGLCLLPACESQRPSGRCLGLQEQDKKKPGLDYEVSVLNVALAVIFVETIFVPLVVVFKETLCPVEQSPPGATPAGPQKVTP